MQTCVGEYHRVYSWLEGRTARMSAIDESIVSCETCSTRSLADFAFLRFWDGRFWRFAMMLKTTQNLMSRMLQPFDTVLALRMFDVMTLFAVRMISYDDVESTPKM